jgi:hypothetical protein
VRSKQRVSASVLLAGTCAALLPLAGWLAACGQDGSAPYAGWDTVTDSEGVYKLRFLAPPWERVDTGSDLGISLLVPPVFGSLDAGAPSKYSFDAKLVPGLALPVVQAEVARIAGARVLLAPTPFATISEDRGFTAVLEDSARLRYFRLVTLTAPGGRSLLVRVTLNEDPRNDREIDAMIRAIDVRPFAD